MKKYLKTRIRLAFPKGLAWLMTFTVIVPHVGAGKGGDSSFHSSAAALSGVVRLYGWIGFPAIQQTVSGVLLESSLESWNSP